MSQNAKQSSLEFRRCATSPIIVLLARVPTVLATVCWCVNRIIQSLSPLHKWRHWVCATSVMTSIQDYLCTPHNPPLACEIGMLPCGFYCSTCFWKKHAPLTSGGIECVLLH